MNIFATTCNVTRLIVGVDVFSFVLLTEGQFLIFQY